MSIQAARQHLSRFGKDGDVLEFDTSSATVELAANALGVRPARIAKTISLLDGDSALLIMAAGDVRIDNAKFRAVFGFKPRMLTPEQALHFTGHEVGGICPFGLIRPLRVFADISLRRFETVYPACGSSNSAVPLTCDELFCIAGCHGWVDVCRPFPPPAPENGCGG